MVELADSMIAHMTLVDWLDDLTVRFLLNLPAAELSSVPRLCFQVEEAQWFYEDFIRPANPTLPSLNLRQFLLTLFQHCPLLSGFDATQHVAAYEEFLSYKVRVPVRGAILMDDSMEKVLLVRGWKKGASWSFPRGKINKDEKDLDCAIREVYEETGYDVAAAGLVEPNQGQDGQVKAIDITMREQHMKLFVFRGVPLDTYFEPRTRKEISKISWYNVKDLPGFKKQKGLAGQGQGEAASSKFYMVAPFLGPLKKWIGQQRRDDYAAAKSRHDRNLSVHNDFPIVTTEDEIDTEQEFATDNGLGRQDRSADELKRLLSIGHVSSPPPPPSEHTQGSAQTNNLLAMLRGSQSSVPHTPMEQIDPVFPTQQPETPQPYHPRHPSTSVEQQQQAVPQFAFSPRRMQQEHQSLYQQRNASIPTSDVFHTGAHAQAHPQHHQNMLPHFQQPAHQHERPGSLPMFEPGRNMRPHPSYQYSVAETSRNLHQAQASQNLGPQDWQSFAGPAAPLASPMPVRDLPQSREQALWQTAQQVQKPLGSEHSVPEPSKLPPPRLNEHSMKLLNVFKGTGSNSNATEPSLALHSNIQRAGSQQQQAALLDLFRKSTDNPASSVTSVDAPAELIPASPALTDITVKPAAPVVVRQTSALNEVTRTLPAKPKTKTTVSSTGSAHSPRFQQPDKADEFQSKQSTRLQRTPRAVISEDEVADRPQSRGQLYNPSKPQKLVRASSQTDILESETGKSSFVNAQRPASRHPPQSTNPNKVRQRPTSSETLNMVPQFSILQRPGSSAGRGAQVLPQSPLRQEATPQGFQPQLLKRTGSAEVDTSQEAKDLKVDPGDAKKDRLLSLFGKVPGAGVQDINPEATVSDQPRAGESQKNTLLNLFNGSIAPPSTGKTPEPPAAPRLSPERKPTSLGPFIKPQPPGLVHTSQQTLLSLFNKPSSSNVTSPGTPISPFTLSSPATTAFPPPKLSTQGAEPRSKLGTMVSAISNGSASGPQTPKSATPTAEAKGFMLEYLNGVVQKEGYRGAKKH